MNIGSTIKFVVSLLVVAITLFFASSHISAYLKERAIDNCARISRYQTQLTDQNATVWYPIVDVYKQCLRDKGYGAIAGQK